MAFKVKEFAKFSRGEISDLFNETAEPRCSCGVRAGNEHLVGGKPACEDCYFDAIDREVSEHPIIYPRLRRDYPIVDSQSKHKY